MSQEQNTYVEMHPRLEWNGPLESLHLTSVKER
jgi:hypothetical protein